VLIEGAVVLFDREAIEHWIPHREPFLLVDEIVEFEAGRRAVSITRMKGDEAFFDGHFPGRPLMPGALILENMAQTANFLVARSAEVAAGEATATMVVGTVNRARFLLPVVPPAALVTEIKAVKLFSTMGIVEATSSVDDELVATARLQFGAIE
jgi:3-hydroxyacyl-[acyl-carrier-protein] dehydratase